MSPESTRLLVEQAQSGDECAFEALVNQYYTMVHGLALSRVHDWAAADDLAQDVFLVAWSNLSRLRAPGAFLVWIRRIVRNASLNWIRAQDYRRKLADRHVEQNGEGIPVEPDPSSSASREECREQVRKALETLSPKLREAMTLYYLEGNTASSAADALGISVDTMKKRLRLGRARLQRYYEARQIEEIEQVLPERPQRQIERIVAGLAIGPVMPEWGAKIAGRSALGASTITTSAASFAGVLTGAAASMAILAGAPFQWDAGAETAAARIDVIATDSFDAEDDVKFVDGAVTGKHLVALADMDSAEPGGRGIRSGDTIVAINGQPIAQRIDSSDQGVLGHVPGSEVRITYIPDGSDDSVRGTATIIWPYEPNRFGPSN